MKKSYGAVIFLAVILVLVIAFPSYGDVDKDTGALVRRLAIIIGANNGGSGRPQLRYAETDAKEMSQVLLKMGGIQPEDHTLLLEPTKEALLNTFSRLHTKINDLKRNYRRVELVFYYSGHSDEEGLLLGESRIPYKSLRQAIDNSEADFRIVILDSCASGAFTLLKGGKRQPPFLMDSSANMTGYAFLTSSSSEEPSQESDQIRGSFFTHFLLSALRGAADAALDGKITLNEAYQYAFRETLSRTENTINGPQHPSYDIEMTGAGDVVMTDIHEIKSRLLFAEDVYGKIYIHNDSDILVVELNKTQGKQIEIGLEPGRYRISIDQELTHYQTEISIKDGEKVLLSGDKFYPVKTEKTAKRGNEDEVNDDSAQPDNSNFPYINNPLKISIVPLAPMGYKEINNLCLGLVGSYSTKLNGSALSAGINIVGEDANGLLASGIGNYVEGRDDGLCAAGIFNINGNDFNGGEAAGIFNLTLGSASFWKAAGIFNMTLKNFNGFESAGIFNMVDRDFNGFGAAGIFNYNGGNGNGFQSAGIFNLTEGSFNGFQTAGIFNYTDASFKGFQVAGVFNYAGKMDGFQCGTVNVADEMHGLQIGVINVANKMDGVPVGLLSLIKDGKHNFSLSTDETGFCNLGFKLGSKNFYNIYTAGVKTPSYFQDNHFIIDTNPELAGLGLGLGVSKRIWPFAANLEVLGQSIQNYQGYDIKNNRLNMLRLRASLSLPLFGGLAVTAGYSYNYFLDTQNFVSRYQDFLSQAKVVRVFGNDKCYAWSGYFFEVQL